MTPEQQPAGFLRHESRRADLTLARTIELAGGRQAPRAARAGSPRLAPA